MNDVFTDLRQAVRALRRRPRFVLAAGLVLALGMGASVSVFSVVRAYLLRPLPFPDADRLVWIIAGPARNSTLPFPEGLGEADWSAAGDVFSRLVAWDLDGFTLTGEPAAEYVDGAWVSPAFFPTVGARPALGRTFTEAEAVDGAPVAVISHDLWRRRFGSDSGVLGRRIELFSTDRPREAQVVTIVGVLPADFWYVNRFTDVLLPLRGSRMPTVARLAPGVTIAQAQDRLNAVIQPQLRNVAPGWRLSLVSVHDEHVYQARPVILLLFGAATCVLLVACANAAGLLLARGAERAREIAIRTALGASGGRIVRQLLAESVILAAGGAAAGAALAVLLVPAIGPALETQLGATVPGGLARLAPDAVVLCTTALVALATGLLFGLRPALSAGRREPGLELRGSQGIAGGRSAARARGVLVAAEIAVACVLVVGTGLMVRTLGQLRRVELGFDDRDVVKAELLIPLARYPEPDDRARLMDRLETEVSLLTGVTASAAAFPYPFRPAPTRDVAAAGGSATARAAVRVTTPSYFEALRVPVRGGRAFRDGDRGGAEPVAMVSADLAGRLWPDGDAVGRLLDLDPRDASDAPARVVGITGDVRESLVDEPIPDVYLPYAQNPVRFVALLVRAPGRPGLAAALMDAARRVDVTLAPTDVVPLAQVVDRERAPRRLLARVLAGVAILVLVVGAVGLYATIGYLVHQRRREFAVRLAVGAQRREIVLQVLRDGGRLTALGLGLGLGASLTLARLLGSQLHGVSALDPLAFTLALVVLGATALLALALPARSAARIDPMEALRHE